MKEFLKKNLKVILIVIAIIIQSIIFIIAGNGKSYIHMDEAYSLGLASYDKTEIQDNDDFYDTWHSNEYYEDYLVVNDDEIGEYKQVYVNQINDVHPPLYYLLLRFAMGFSINHFSMWPGIVLNMIIYIFITIFMYLLIREILSKTKYSDIKAIIIAVISSITLASITNVIYIRMYALSTFNIILTSYFHVKFLKSNYNNKYLIGIGISALVGSLTHYYYLFYLAMLALMVVIKLIREKKLKVLAKYLGTLIIAAIVSLIIFPYSIKHLFFGYRGQGAISNLLNIRASAQNIISYIDKLNIYGFNSTLYMLLIVLVVIILDRVAKKKKLNISKNLKFIILPSLFYFLLVSVSSPWIELRYIMPVCGVIFTIILIIIVDLLTDLLKEKQIVIAEVILCVMILVMPNILSIVNPSLNIKVEPEEMFSDKRDIVQFVKENSNAPALFWFKSSNNRFLDDILLFAIIDNSYIAKDENCDIDNIQNIMQGKDLSNGMLVFINEGQENDKIVETIKQATGLSESSYLKRLNACDVYYLK